MSSSILYKFRSGTSFEALPLPGSAARLFDVKRAIVKAKKLDATSSNLEFDLSVRDATTQQEYADESMLLPRGTRLVVQRLPAARGHGFLARMARAESGLSHATAATTGTAAPSGFYTIESRPDHEDEFVQQPPKDEVAALLAVTETNNTQGTSVGGFRPATTRIAGQGAPPPPPPRAAAGAPNYYQKQRPNADPELRDQEQKQLPKKRATGIPRTFLNLSAPPTTTTDNPEEAAEAAVARLQPNALGFAELVSRGGGQSEAAQQQRSLDYALKLTATTIPEHLQCGICHSVVKNAMLLPWDPEGRTACESCIRDALTQNGFHCPLSGMEGVSPDDLLPNTGLRKAAELFIKGVMEKMEEIEKQQVEEMEDETTNATSGTKGGFEGDSTERGVILSKKTRRDVRNGVDDDPFGGGGDDPFGGDVFDVGGDDDEEKEEEANDEEKEEATTPKEAELTAKPESSKDNEVNEKESKESNISNEPETTPKSGDAAAAPVSAADTASAAPVEPTDSSTPVPKKSSPPELSPAEKRRRRGPPAGYAMGPAGGAATSARSSNRPSHDDRHKTASPAPFSSSSPRGNYHQDRQPYRGRGGRFGGGGRGRYQGGDYESRGGGHYSSSSGGGHNDDDGYQPREAYPEDDSRGTKRPRNGSEDGSDDRYRGERRDWSQGGQQYDRSRGGGYDSRRGGGRFFRGGDYGGRRGGRGRGRCYGRGRY